MASASVSNCPVLLRPRNFQWYWGSNPNPSSDEHWLKYTDVENEIIEDAFQENKLEVDIDDDYIINLNDKLQYRRDKGYKQYPIKRVYLDRDRSNLRLREERFALPIALSSSTDIDTTDLLNKIRSGEMCITAIYVNVENRNEEKAIIHIIEDAIKGIIKEGIALGKEHEAQWLAQQLKNVLVSGTEVKITDSYEKDDIPSVIGDTLIYLYTKESFWYKLINRILRNIKEITREQIKTIGPFCYLLDRYLQKQHRKRPAECLTVYRGLNLTDGERQEYLEKRILDTDMIFTAFTSTTRNRDLAEIYGNTLLIINLDRRYGDLDNYEKIRSGIDISNVSSFPEEEEFLMWPYRRFELIRFQYDETKKKHIIHLRAAKYFN